MQEDIVWNMECIIIGSWYDVIPIWMRLSFWNVDVSELGKNIKIHFSHNNYKYCAQLKNHHLLLTRKPHSLIHIRAHPFVHHPNHCFNIDITKFMWDTKFHNQGGPSIMQNFHWTSLGIYHTLVQWFAFNYIHVCFPCIVDPIYSLHIFLSQSQYILSIEIVTTREG